ncbi:MAG: BTAD domain-containing putative transcriptional regulator [Actinomycetota bacterium]|nr:BTAD domain-containing putative transcriptional regulator [Actinomycetota bacterium]
MPITLERAGSRRWETPGGSRASRRGAVEDRIEAKLGLGSSDDAVTELRALLAEAPLREHAWALLMRALVAAGTVVPPGDLGWVGA